MFQTTTEFESAVKKVLLCISEEKPLSEIADKLGAICYGEVVLFCNEQKYVSGLSASRCNGNKIAVQENNPRLTYYGLQFLGF